MENEESQNKEKKHFSAKIKNYVHNLLDFSKFDKKTIIFIGIFIILIIFSIFLLYYSFFIDTQFLYRIVVEWFVNPIYLLGFLGILLFIVIMAIQGLIVPIPSEIVLLATGMIWGLVGGGFMGIIGSMAAAMLCFYVSKKGGRQLAKKFVGEKAIEMADNFIHKYGIWAIIIARFLPFIAFDPISYASGLVDMDVKKYSIGSFIGSIPRAFFYSWLGASLGIVPPINFNDLPYEAIDAQANLFNNVLLIVLVVLVGIFIAYYLFSKFYGKKNS
ncbi:MAG: TVP38/TMEM64 family protein [Candidatus Lokiarchaeota archaeon]|nr:TVP38/TMEM64 family protein [Candidatus Lokiarchaeota archaeon]